MKTIILSVISVCAGAICLIIFGNADPKVDANGILQEPFFLLVIGYVLIAIGILLGCVAALRRALSAKNKL